jgi:hypothetical protein
MKVQSGSAVMFHYLPGQHHHVAEWHNEIHRPEIQGAVPHVFYSQDFVAPPAYVAARDHANLPMSGGEYLSVYWSEGSLEAYGEDSRKASQDRRNASSYHPFQDVVWATRLRATAAHPRQNLGYDVNAAPLTPNMGLVLVAERLTVPERATDYTRWLSTTHVPRVLGLGPFSACFEFMQDDTQVIQFWFVDRSDPLDALEQFRHAAPDAEMAALRGRVFCGAYQPVITGQYDIYT